MRRRRLVARWTLVRRALVMALVVVVALGVGVPDDVPAGMDAGSDSVVGFVHGLLAFLAVPPSWAGPTRPHIPGQDWGTAAGLGHQVPAARTRAGGGTGHVPGKGVGELPAQASARKAVPGASATVVRGFDAKTSVRDAKRSTATSTYYHNADGSITRKMSQAPVNFRDNAGNWQLIDTTLHQGGDGRWRERGNTVPGGFARFADDPALLVGGVDDAHTFAEHLIGAGHVPAVVAGSTVTFPGALPGTDVRLTATRVGQREEFVLHDASAASSWTNELSLTGLAASIDGNGDVDLADASGKTVLVIPVGTATDSTVDKKSGEPAAARVRYSLSGNPGRQTLTTSVDPAWLGASARRFPVTVDPQEWFTSTYAEQGDGVTGDRSAEGVLKIGSPDSGTHAARSFLEFPDSGIDNSGITATDATLELSVTFASTCTPEEVDVAPITAAWTPQTVTSYPGPVFGASVGSVSPAVPVACGSTTGEPDHVNVPIATSVVNGWANGSTPDYGLGVYAPTTDSLHWKIFSSGATDVWGPFLMVNYSSGKLLPYVYTQDPPAGAAPGTLTPLLSAEGTGVVDYPAVLEYEFLIYSPDGVKVADSGLTTSNSFRVPAGALQWGKAYAWTVQAYDGLNYSPNAVWNTLSTAVPQPPVTSSLSQNSDAKGYDPSIGNYTTSTVDVDVATAGPALSVQRDYNSRDPRTAGAFGAAWSSLLDARATERYDESGAVNTVVVTYPTGAEVAFGRNFDGSFVAPSGRAATLIHRAGGYELIDQAGTVYTFNQVLTVGASGTSVVGVGKVADIDKHTLSITGTAASGTTVMKVDVSGRKLTLGWQTPAGATSPHVATVSTDPATTGGSLNVWTYRYSGDRLTAVCLPASTTACTTYGYRSDAPADSRNQLLDLDATSYWPLAETSGTTAASSVLANEGTDAGTYSNVTLAAGAGPLGTAAVQTPSFNGSTSTVYLPDLKVGGRLALSTSIWFKAAPGTPAGVLYSNNSDSAKMTPSNNTGGAADRPTIYLGTSGKVYGGYWPSADDLGSPNPIPTKTAVADGTWHNIVLTGSASAQTMYLDGVPQGTIPGWSAHNIGVTVRPSGYRYSFVGAGYLGFGGGSSYYPDQPYQSSTPSATQWAAYFKGSLADFAYYSDKVLGPTDAMDLYHAGLSASTLLTSITRPSGKAFAGVAYDPVSGTVTGVTDQNGGTWAVGAPSVAGSSQVYRASVLGSGPLAYYRLGDPAGSGQAYSEVHYPAGTYGSTMLGTAGPFADEPAATFNGTSSYVQVPSGVIGSGAGSQELWFSTKSTGGVLLSSQNSAVGGYDVSVSAVDVGHVGRKVAGVVAVDDADRAVDGEVAAEQVPGRQRR